MIKAWGTVYRIHPLFSLMIFVSVLTGYVQELLILFGIVLIHELGHVFAAKSFGWRIKEVLLFPFGGVAVTDESGTVPVREEMIVALAGPLQNGWMICFSLLMKWTGWWSADWADYFLLANLKIALFNLIPVLPLDGGKMMQALVSLRIPYRRTLSGCFSVSLCLSALLILSTIVPYDTSGIQLNLLMIGLFLLYVNWYGYRQTAYHFFRFLLHRSRNAFRLIGKGTLAQPIVVGASQKIIDIVHLFMREKYHLIYVLGDHGGILAVLPEQQITDAFLVDKKPQSAVSELFM